MEIFGPASSKNARPIWERLELMRKVWARRPSRVMGAPRATGRVLRDFYMALEAGNPESADAAVRYLAEQRRLTPSNILFLRIQGLARFGEWEAILGRPELPDLLQMRRPLAVTEALLRAVYRVELEVFERHNDVDGAVAHFRTSVLPRFGTLFLRRVGFHSPEALKALMLLAVTSEPQDANLRDLIWAARGIGEDDRLYLSQLSQRIQVKAPAPQEVSLEAAFVHRNHGDYESAYQLALQSPKSPARARLLVECAYELQVFEVIRLALAAVSALTVEERGQALSGRRFRELYDSLTRLGERGPEAAQSIPTPVVQTLPGNWIEWLDRVVNDTEWVAALNAARRGAEEWSIEEFLAVPNCVESILTRLNSLAGNSTVQNAIPHLVAFFRRDALWPRPELASLYAAILDLLAMGSNGGEDDVRVYAQLTEGCLELGVDSKIYKALLSDLGRLLSERPSPGRLASGLEALEATLIYPCPNEESRLTLLLQVAALAQKFWRRIDGGQRSALRLLCADIGYPEVFDSLAPQRASDSDGDVPFDALSQLNGKTVAIYTLSERAARYMQSVIGERAPLARVTLAHDKVGSGSLRNLARRADVFIMATASATHAATGFIEANRPAGRPLLKPSGKGMASMLQVLLQFLETGGSEDFQLAS